METETSLVLTATATFFLTYLVHSTLALLVAWFRVRLASRQRHRLAERWWKVAATLPLVTAALQTTLGGALLDRPLTAWASGNERIKPVSTYQRESRADMLSSATDDDVDQLSLAQTPATPDSEGGWRWTVGSKSPAVVTTRHSPLVSGGSGEDRLNDWLALARNPWLPETIAHGIATLGLCIMAVGFARFTFQTVALWRRLTNLPELRKGRVRHLLDDLLERAGVRHPVCLRQADETILPFAYGVFRWTITVPRRIESKLDAEQLKALLAHELAHLVRRDTGWLHAGRLLGTCFFFQPLNYLARARWLRAAEYCCDDWAVRQAIHPVALAHCLTNVAQYRMRPWSPASLGMADDPSLLSNRVERLLRDSCSRVRRPSIVRQFVTFAATIVAGTWLIMVSPTVSISSTSGIELNVEDMPDEVESEIELLTAALEELDHEMQNLDYVLTRTPKLAEKVQVDRRLAAAYGKMRRRQAMILDRQDHLIERIRSRSSRHGNVSKSVSKSR